ncbi:MAG: hypothetical protein A7316_00485 [Candidatus Altiarchaeales archaeon WOR_SM1_86-2]|nr:MAG: hypothetical protein A7316_00485 [Candidatus Altiarchaeales archaeon WOR_SM1_86-2]
MKFPAKMDFFDEIRNTRAKITSKEIGTIIFVIAGLFLLFYSFIAADTLVGGESIIENAILKIILLTCMIAIGIYLINKIGSSIEESLNIIAVVLLSAGVGMLVFSFITANAFVNEGPIQGKPYWVKGIFFCLMIGVGYYLTKKGIELVGSKVSGIVTAPIGIGMLLYSFITANKFVGGHISIGEHFIDVRFFFFILMVAIGVYLSGRGAAELKISMGVKQNEKQEPKAVKRAKKSVSGSAGSGHIPKIKQKRCPITKVKLEEIPGDKLYLCPDMTCGTFYHYDAVKKMDKCINCGRKITK